jgi:hypothetical protein
MARRWPLVTTGVVLLILVSGHTALAAEIKTWPKGQIAPPAPDNQLGPGQAPNSKATTQSPSKPAPQKKSLAPKGATPYSMDFTLPTLGKSGCGVCHADPNLIRIKQNQYVSFYVPPEVIDSSAHGPGPKTGKAGVLCTGCHLDFAATSKHNDTNWQRTAKMACRSCHTNEQNDYAKGRHAVNSKPGQADANAEKKPLCGDCHGDHDIARLDDAGRASLHKSGWQVCGRCHPNEWNSYSDYYHGAAYRGGAPDAPACWDCHDSHNIMPSSDPRSPTNGANLVQTCGGPSGKKCHDNVNDEFVSYAGLIHRKAKALDANPMYSWMQKTTSGISAALSGIADVVRSLFT